MKEIHEKETQLHKWEERIIEEERGFINQEKEVYEKLYRLGELFLWFQKQQNEICSKFPEFAMYFITKFNSKFEEFERYESLQLRVTEILQQLESILEQREHLIELRKGFLNNLNKNIDILKNAVFQKYNNLNLMLRNILSQEGREKRNEPRILTDLPVELQTDMNVCKGTTENITINGIFVKTDHFLPIGEKVKIKITSPVSPERDLLLKGTVVWIREGDANSNIPPGIGIKFSDMDEKDLQILEKIVHTGIGETIE